MDTVKNGTAAPDISYLNKVRSNVWKRCSYFCYTLDNKYVCNPDGLGPAGISLEVKTRAAGSTGPITSSENFPQYYIQCQLQMLCTEADFCILQSYHPETNSSNCFLVQQSYTLIQVIKEVIDSVYNNNKMLEWNHIEIKELRNFGENVIG